MRATKRAWLLLSTNCLEPNGYRVRMRRMRRLNRTTEKNDGITRRWSTDRSTKTTPKWNWQ